MATESTRTGIDAVGDVAWGTHLCHFYETKQDLLDTLIPYFRAGVENGELCVWVVAESLTVEEARDALRRGIPEAERRLSAGDIEIITHAEWYLPGGAFDARRVAEHWAGRSDDALAKGYAGMRGNGAPASLVEAYREDVVEFERALDETLAGKRMILLCSYSLSEVDAALVFDVLQTHGAALVRRHGRWEVLESAELKRARREIEELNAELEQRVARRTRELEAANEELKKEVARRERVEAAEAESRRLYEALVQSIDGIVCEMEGETFRVTFVSRRAEEILGYPVARWTAEPDFWINHLHPDDRARTVEAKAEAVARREGRRLDYRMIAADGRVIWFRDILTVVVRLDGSTLLRGVKLDVTERKLAEEALRISEENFRKAFYTSPAPAAIVRIRDGQWLNVNSAFERTFGYTAAEAVGKTGAELGIWPDPRVQEELWLRFQQDDNSINNHEVRLVTKSGAPLDVLLSTQALELSGEACFLASIIDITERKRAEDKNRRLLSELAERVKELTTLYEAARILQNGGGDLASTLRELADLLPPAFRHPESTAARVRVGTVEAATPGFADSPASLRAEFTTADGQTGSIEVVSTAGSRPETESPFLTEERQLVNTLSDMLRAAHDRRQAEAHLRATGKQLRALSARLSSAREEEGARIAREIHDELGAALSSLRWDLEEVCEALSESADAARVAALRRKVAGMMNLTDTTVNTVRRIASELRPVALDDLGLTEAIEWQAEQFHARTGIVVSCDCRLENVELSREQATAVFRIFQEVLTNVLRHARASRVDVALKREADGLVLTVGDDGRGITAEELSGSQTLGLLGMRERAGLVGGELDIRGSEGRGTTVTVRIPLSG